MARRAGNGPCGAYGRPFHRYVRVNPLQTFATGSTWTPPTLPGSHVLMACRDRLHPYIRTFAAACAAAPDGIGWLAPIRFVALEVLRTLWV
jgi:hypothetical protein